MAGRKAQYLTMLADRCLKGDDSAWAEMVRIITPSIFGVCKSMRLTREDSLETFGQVSYLLLKILPKLRSPAKILSFVSVTTRREALRTRNRAKILDRILSTKSVYISATQERNPEELLEAKQRRETLVAAVLSLPEKESKLMWSLFFDESRPKYKEISKKLGMPVSSIGPTRARCLEKLRKVLKRKDYDF
jgi:RNA polymerase sigma factor (sigma-70 family)